MSDVNTTKRMVEHAMRENVVIYSKPSTDAYREGYDRIFSKKNNDKKENAK